ncbi:MAG: hypothetical protein AB8B46_00335 [Candidatus Midichloriaceae bacterium]
MIQSIINNNIKEISDALNKGASPDTVYTYNKYNAQVGDYVYDNDTVIKMAINKGKYVIAALLVTKGAKVTEYEITKICENLIKAGKQHIVTGLFYKIPFSEKNEKIKEIIRKFSNLDSYVKDNYSFDGTEESYEEKKQITLNSLVDYEIKSEKQMAQEEYLNETLNSENGFEAADENQIEIMIPHDNEVQTLHNNSVGTADNSELTDYAIMQSLSEF